MKTRWMACLLALACVACSSVGATDSGTQAQESVSDLVYLSDGSGVVAVDPDSTGREEYPGAVFSADRGSLVYPSGGSLVGIDSESGADVWSFATQEGLVPVVAGRDRVALVRPGEGPTDTYAVTPRRSTEIIVANIGTRHMKPFRLFGNYAPEAFSYDERELFLIEYIPAMAPERYRVRRLIIRSGRVLPIGRQKLAAPDEMRGTGRVQVMAPNETRLYTLYTRQPANTTHGTTHIHRPGHVHAFVHVLSLNEGWAHCVDLPMPFGAGAATGHAIAVTPDGGHVYVVDGSTGTVVAIDTGRLARPTTTESLDLSSDEPAIAASSERVYVAAGDEVVVLDAPGLEEIYRWTLPAGATGVALSEDGARLYVTTTDELLGLDAATGETEFSSAVEAGYSVSEVVTTAP